MRDGFDCSELMDFAEKLGAQPKELEKAQKKIEEAGHAVGEAQKRSGLIQRKLKDVDTLEAPEVERVLGMEGTEEGIL